MLLACSSVWANSNFSRQTIDLGMVVSGCATAAVEGEKPIEMRAGDIFYVSATPHDSWVVGDEPYVSLHFLGADHYAADQ